MDGLPSQLLQAEIPKGALQPVQPIKGSPVPHETVLQNIRDSADFDYPVFRKQPKREGSCIFVAGGPTLLQFVDEIRARKQAGEFILTSNNTHDWLIDRGIVPDACLIFDPKQRVKDYVTKPQAECMYYLGVSVCRAVFERFQAANVPCTRVLVAYGNDDESDIKLQHTLYPTVEGKHFLIGGTMTPLRAMPFASMLGFGKIEYYGMDSCFGEQPELIRESDPRFKAVAKRTGHIYDNDAQIGERYALDEPENGGFFYAYRKDRSESIIIQKCGDRLFLTSPGFAYQCKQLVEWADRMESKVDVAVHGDSLTAHAWKLHCEDKARRYAKIGDRRWTEKYAQLQADLHAGQEYGTRGGRNFEPVARQALGVYAQIKRPLTVLDYGCGNGQLKAELEAALKFVSVTNYDPFQPQYAADPAKHDLLACFDVLEHVEEECVDNTLRYMAERVAIGAIFQICLVVATKTLADGRNAHITVKNAEWWRNRLQKYFQIAEITVTDTHLMVGCAARNAEERAAA